MNDTGIFFTLKRASSMALSGVILCGGLSTRMGSDKAWLPIGAEPMLARVVRLLSEVARPIVVVAAAEQDLPPLPESVRVVRDQREQAGPLEGVRAGLAGLLETGLASTSAAYVTSCDVPLLVPAFVSRLASLLDDFDIVVPTEIADTVAGTIAGQVADTTARLFARESAAPASVAGSASPRSTREPAVRLFHHPLAAIYRLAVLPRVIQLLAANHRRMTLLLDECRTRRVLIDELRDVDSRLESLLNVNRPADYEQALRRV